MKNIIILSLIIVLFSLSESYCAGIGAILKSDFERTIVAEIIKGYGGERAGLLKGDEILYIKSSDRILHLPMNYKNVIREFISGPENTSIYAAVKRKGKIRILKIVRDFKENLSLFKNNSFIRSGIYAVKLKTGLKIIHLRGNAKIKGLKIDDIIKFIASKNTLVSFREFDKDRDYEIKRLIIIRKRKISIIRF